MVQHVELGFQLSHCTWSKAVRQYCIITRGSGVVLRSTFCIQ
ncbi:hypothetical protein MtrunA17_Chr3g0133561 [Medicago truncatula]|uniref:Uncharacterized protein n=1 Tax=Medicago truncatula TaxID=3880 RepID=A0A396J0N5_MEDTR|nr:hypothetical protein MtrunA17_Chr3g0133561 [Medicago truncatula]